jgi:hypothetical protein
MNYVTTWLLTLMGRTLNHKPSLLIPDVELHEIRARMNDSTPRIVKVTAQASSGRTLSMHLADEAKP